jgi:integrase
MLLSEKLHNRLQLWIQKSHVNTFQNENNNFVSNKMLFRDFFKRYLKSLDGSSRSRTYSSTLSTASYILDGLGDYRMDEINKTVLREFINGFTKATYIKSSKKGPEYYSQSTIDKVYHLLHAAIIEASSDDGDHFLRTDFMANMKIPRSNRFKSPESTSLSDGEIKMLTDVIRENAMILVWVLLMLYTGVRPSEALALKFSDINYENKTVQIVRTLSYVDDIDPETRKRRGPRRAYITTLKNQRENHRANYQVRILRVGDKILQVLKEWENHVKGNETLMAMKQEKGTAEYLFCGSKGQLWLYDDYKQLYARLLKKHGLSISDYYPYRFRHNCCTRLFRLGVNIKTVQMIMGDNTPDMVMRVYANLDRFDVLQGSQHYADSLDMALGVMSDPET